MFLSRFSGKGQLRRRWGWSPYQSTWSAAVRTTIVVVAILNFFVGLALWGTTTTVRVAG